MERISKPDEAVAYMIDAMDKITAARTFDDLKNIARDAACTMTGADIVTIERGPQMEDDVNGWVWRSRQVAVVEDVLLDSRTAHDSTITSTFQSLMVIPIREDDPIGVMGVYWCNLHQPRATEVVALKLLADGIYVALKGLP